MDFLTIFFGKISAINAKTLKVQFNKAADIKEADFSVKKGTIKANVAKVIISEDKKSATVELTSKFTKGEYTVTVANGEKGALTGSTTVEDERVEKIEILSTSAPLFDSQNADTDTNKDDITVGYKVLNQYGDDITKITTVTATASTGIATSSNGVIEVRGDFKEGDKTTVTLVHAESAKTVTATLTASAEAKAAEVEIKGLYNVDNKALNEDIDLSKDTFYLEVVAKDQYGNDIKAASQLNSDVIINETNPNIADIASTFTEISVNGTKKLVLAISNPVSASKAVAGETRVTLISKATGKNAQYVVNVAEGQRADVVNLSQPNLVAVGEDALVPAEVIDKNGNAITDIKVLNNATKGVKVTLGNNAVTFVEKDGIPYVKLPSADLTTEGPVALVAVSSTTKVQTLTLNVKAAAKPVIVTGLTSTFGTTFKAGISKNITVADLLIEDQYGRVMDATKVNDWLDAALANKIVITEDETSSIVGISNVAGADTIAATGQQIAVVPGASKGTENVTITLHDANGAIASSAKEISLRVTDGSEYKSYEVKPVGTVYDEKANSESDVAAYNKTVKVYGVLNDGSKVLLANGTDYAVSSTDATLHADVVTDGIINVSNAYTTYKTGENEIKLPLTVVINATGEKLNQEVTISKAAPKVAKIDVVAEGKGNDFINGDTVDKVEKFNYDASVNGAFNFAKLDENADVVVTDQYGVSVVLDGTDAFEDGTPIASAITFTKSSGEVAFNGNGTATASVNEMPSASAFNVVVSVGTVDSSTIKVTATSAYSTAAAVTTELSTAKTAIEGLTNTEVGTVVGDTTAAQVKTKVENAINALASVTGKGFTVTVNETSFAAPEAGTSTGSYVFTVTLGKAGQTVTTGSVTITIPQA